MIADFLINYRNLTLIETNSMPFYAIDCHHCFKAFPNKRSIISMQTEKKQIIKHFWLQNLINSNKENYFHILFNLNVESRLSNGETQCYIHLKDISIGINAEKVE